MTRLGAVWSLGAALIMGCGSKWEFEDGDGDGISALEGDCWDKAEGPEGSGLSGKDIHPDAVETWYDGFDQNCSGDDDFDADGDGYVPDEHVGKETLGQEESGFLPPGDCWDLPEGPLDDLIPGAEINPVAGDTWYDGIDQDCGGEDDFDADGDDWVRTEDAGQTTVGVDGSGNLGEGDCWDDPETLPDGMEVVDEADELYQAQWVNPGIPLEDDEEACADALGFCEYWYDGINGNCDTVDDFDRDGDGFRTLNHDDATGEAAGTDCFDDEVNDALPAEADLEHAIASEELSTGDVLDFLGLSAADIYEGADDPFYDGLNQDCGVTGLDCDADGDSFDATGGGQPACADDPEHPLCAYEVCSLVDCDDTDDDIQPEDTPEIFYNGIDDNCDLSNGDGDADGDRYWAKDYEERVEAEGGTPLEVPSGWGGDCDDSLSAINPGQIEIWYNGIDDNCDGADDFDQDGDGYYNRDYEGDYWPTTYAESTTGGLPGNDCDDSPTGRGDDVHPGATDTWYDGEDTDCDGRDDYDQDEDGFHSRDHEDDYGPTTYAESTTGDLSGNDCDDEREEVNPDATDTWYDGEDTDCDGRDDYDRDEDGYYDRDYEGSYGATTYYEGSGILEGGDCDDGDDERRPDRDELCSTSYDDDCDDNENDRDATGCNTYYADRDADTYGDPDDDRCYCEFEGVWNETDDDDCDDDSDTTYPGAANNESSSSCRKDDDGDGYGDESPPSGVTAGGDCNDDDSSVRPGASDAWYDGIDKNCSGNDDYDRDGDGYYNEDYESSYGATTYAESTTGDLPGGDCDDTDPEVHPDRTELCSTSYDDDCDGNENDRDATGCNTYYADRDADGYGDPDDDRCYCGVSGVWNETDDDDCDDGASTTHPGAAESESSSSCRKDADTDGYGDEDPPSGVTPGGDCNDSSSSVRPGVSDTWYDGIDKNCSGNDDYDRDGDGYYNEDYDSSYGPTTYAELTTGDLPGDDCDDTDPEVHPDRSELCSTSYDDDCDGTTNERDATGCNTYYADRDEDGYGDPGDSRCYCAVSSVWNETDNDDCDDDASTTHPGAAENESPSACRKDADTDGYGDDSPPSGVSAGGDCRDDDDDVHPFHAELCSTAYDDDCDGGTNDRNATGCSTFYADRDTDGYGDPDDDRCYCSASSVWNETDDDDCDDGSASTFPGAAESESSSSCRRDVDGDGYGDDSPPSGVTAGGDCNDGNASVHPDRTELCSSSYDDDCDGTTNERDATGCLTYYADRDADNYGDPSDSRCYCSPSSVWNESDDDDCDDDSSTTFPGAAESESSSSCRKDSDTDGYGDDSPPSGVTPGGDCNDSSSSIRPGASETWYDGTDQDCDGESDYDADTDGYTSDDYGGEDCDDTDDSINPDASEDLYDSPGIDDDCDGVFDEDTVAEIIGDDLPVLVFSEMLHNPVATTDSEGEWFEVYNASGIDLYLDNWRFRSCTGSCSSYDSFNVAPESEVMIPDGGYALFCRDPDFLDGILLGSCDYRYGPGGDGDSSEHVSSGFFLTNGGNGTVEIAMPISGSSFEEIDDVYYGGSGWPSFTGSYEGHSIQLDQSGLFSSSLHDDNDDISSWCRNDTSPYVVIGSDTDYGTPGSPNLDCP